MGKGCVFFVLWVWFGCLFVFLKEIYFALMENVGPELEEIREIVAKPAPGSLPSC